MINEEIFFNNEIVKEIECLISLLNVKQREILNQMNNNVNLNPFMFQPNNMMNIPPMNLNQMNIEQPQIDIYKLNVVFESPKNIIVVQARYNETVSNIIKKYKEKSNDYNENFYIYNLKNLNNYDYMNYKLSDLGFKDKEKIQVSPIGSIKAGKIESIFHFEHIN